MSIRVDSAAPEGRGDDPPAHGRVAHAAAIVEQDLAVIQPEHDRQPMADREDVALDGSGGSTTAAEHAAGNAPGRQDAPDRDGGTKPPTRSRAPGREGRGHHGQEQDRVEDEDPAFGRAGHEPVAPRLRHAPAHDGLGGPKQRVGHPDRQCAERRPDHAEPEARGPEQESGDGQRDQWQVQEDPDGRDQVKAEGDQGQCGQPDDGRRHDRLEGRRADASQGLDPPGLELSFQVVERRTSASERSDARSLGQRRHRPCPGGTSQIRAADGQERELAAHVEEEEGTQDQRQEPGQGQRVGRTGVAVHDRGEAERQRHDGRADDRGGQSDEQGVTDRDQGDPDRRRGLRGSRARRNSRARAAASAWSWRPEMARRWVVPVRAKASLSSGSMSSRWPRIRAEASGAVRAPSPSVRRLRQAVRRSPEQASQRCLGTAGVAADAPGFIDGEPKANALGAEEGAVIELAGVERPGDPRELARRLDRLSGPEVGSIARDDDHHPSRGRSPAAAVGHPGQLHDHPGHHARRVAGSVAFARPQPEHLPDHATQPDRPRRLRDAPGQVVGRSVIPAGMMPGGTQCQDRDENGRARELDPTQAQGRDGQGREGQVDPCPRLDRLDVAIDHDAPGQGEQERYHGGHAVSRGDPVLAGCR